MYELNVFHVYATVEISMVLNVFFQIIMINKVLNKNTPFQVMMPSSHGNTIGVTDPYWLLVTGEFPW